MTPFTLPDLPVCEILGSLNQELSNHPSVVLQAPPGAGKTTLVPLSLLSHPAFQDQKIIMLEPRRLAARMAAQRMAEILGESVGKTVGYRIRNETKVSAQTRIEVVTEGILTRLIQNDPELNGIGLIIFDEFHERNLQGDLGLALSLDVQGALRDDLRLLVMSATLDGEAVSQLLDNAPLLTSEGRAFPVEIRHLPRPDRFELPGAIKTAVQQAIKEENGNILVFLPGEREIKQVQALLDSAFLPSSNVLIAPLYGNLPPKEQDRAIAPPPTGQRKIVLATTLAETSLTIEGIRVVIDSGIKRVPRFDPNQGLTKLATVRVSKASAEQRAGRAGRLSAGVCYRLWPQAEHQALMAHDNPEINEAELTSFMLELAAWGTTNPDDLSWLTPPPPHHVQEALALLQDLEALDEQQNLSAHGRDLAKLGLHPRLAHMIRKQECDNDPQSLQLACEIAAILTDGPIGNGDSRGDLRNQHGLIAKHGRVKQTVKNLCKRFKITETPTTNAQEIGALLALAYPDRIAQERTPNSGRYLLSNGRGAFLHDSHPLFGTPYLVIAELGGNQTEAQIFTATPIDKEEIEQIFSEQIDWHDDIDWDSRAGKVKAQKQRRYKKLVLSRQPLTNIAPDMITAALCKGIAKKGVSCLNWDKEAQNLRERIQSAQILKAGGRDWPDLSDPALNSSLKDWLAPYLTGCKTLEQVQRINLVPALNGLLDWDVQQQLNNWVPSHYKVPSGSHIRIDYSTPDQPVLAVKLQEMFGSPTSPTINNGQTPLTLHLLSPAGRPLQVTRDLAGFWENSYDSVKKEMRGRYPKHPWPDNPIDAQATAKTKRALKS